MKQVKVKTKEKEKGEPKAGFHFQIGRYIRKTLIHKRSILHTRAQITTASDEISRVNNSKVRRKKMKKMKNLIRLGYSFLGWHFFDTEVSGCSPGRRLK
jgi:hypothetical protein